MQTFSSLKAIAILIAACVVAVVCHAGPKQRPPELVRARTMEDLVDLSAHPSNVNRLEDAIFLLMAGNISTQAKFQETFKGFDFRQLKEGESFRSGPPFDYARCVHLNVTLLVKVGRVPPGVKEDVSAGMKTWYLTAAFSKENGLLQWWTIWEDE